MPHSQIVEKMKNNKSTSKTLAILSTFNEIMPMQRTSDIAQLLNMNISTVSRHLNTLLDWGFLERDESGYYYPGLQIITLAGTALHNMPVYRYCYSELMLLSNQLGLHGHMSVASGHEIVHLINTCSTNTKQLFIPTGHRQPMYCSAMGRIMMAYMHDEELARIFKSTKMMKITPNTKIDENEIILELQTIQKRGYSIVENELTLEVGSISMPIFDRSRKVVAAISVSMSVNSLQNPQRVKEILKIMSVRANKVSGQLGYFPL